MEIDTRLVLPPIPEDIDNRLESWDLFREGNTNLLKTGKSWPKCLQGKIAFMPEDPMGVWVHIQEVRDLLDVKDRTIRDYEDNYLPRPKTTELKHWMIGSPETGEQWVCDSEDVGRVIAAKNKEIEDLKTKADRLENKCLAKDGTI